MKNFKKAGRALGAAIVAILLLAAPAGAVVITGSGGTLINPAYDTNHDYLLDAGVTANYGDPATGLVGNWTVGGVPGVGGAVTETYSANAAGWSWLVNTTNVNGVPAYNQLTRPTPYTVGTVLYDAINFAGYADSNNSVVNYTLKFANGSPGLTTANWSPIPVAASGSATRASTPINIATLPSPTAATTFRIEYSTTQTRTDSPSSVAVFDEALILPDQYIRLPFTASDPNALTGFEGHFAADMDSGTRFLDISGSGTQTLDLNFGATPQRVDALVFYTYGGFPSDFLVRDMTTSNVVFSVSGVGSVGEVIPVKTSLLTTDLHVEFTRRGDNVAGMYEIIALQTIPEPACLGLLAIGGLMLLRRRC